MDDRAQTIMDDAAERLLRIPGVHNIGFGTKFVDGQMTDTPAILVLTSRKRPMREIPKQDRVPRMIAGVATDVIEAGLPFSYGAQPEGKPAEDYSLEVNPDLVLKSDDYKQRPLIGGLMISSSKTDNIEHKGTLGCFLTPEGDPNKAYGLTCHHVFFFQPSSQAASETVFQPEEDTSSCCQKDFSVGTLVDTKCDSLYDIALVALKPGMTWSPAVRNQGAVTGVVTSIPFDKAATDMSFVTRLKVKKFGITSGETGGEVFASGLAGTSYRKNPFTGAPTAVRTDVKALWVQPRPIVANTKIEVMFGTEGDSGAAVLTVADNKVVGILTGGLRFKMGTKYFGIGLVTPIQTILDRYSGGTPANVPKLVVATSTKASDIRTVPGTARVALPADVLLDRPQAAALESEVRRTKAGRALADLYWIHAGGVKALVNRNRRVAAAWHRSGIAFVVAELLRAYRDPAARLPARHDDRPLIDSIAAFFAVLARFGSDVLKADVARVTALIPDPGGLTFAEILERLDRRPAEQRG